MTKYIRIHKSDLHKRRFTYIQKFLNRFKLIQNGCYLAGGSLRTLMIGYDDIQDYDLYFRDEDALTRTKRSLLSAGFKKIFACPQNKLFTYKLNDFKVQCICEFYYPDIETILNDFDLAACMAGFDGKYVIVHPQFVKDLYTMRLTLVNLTYPIATLNRILKYRDKGFNTSEVTKQYVEQLALMLERGPLTDEQKRVYID